MQVYDVHLQVYGYVIVINIHRDDVIASQQHVSLSDDESLLEQGYHVISIYCTYILYLLSDVQMWELNEIVIPKIKAEWKDLAYCMRYKPEEVEGFRNDSQDSKECCEKLFTNWLRTGHGPTPKTYQTLLKCIKKISRLTAVSKTIEEELINGKLKGNSTNDILREYTHEVYTYVKLYICYFITVLRDA